MPAGDEVRLGLHVRPGAARTRVGGVRGDPPLLLVAVAAPAEDGRATEAVLRAVASALGVRHRQVRLVSGATSRRKVVAISEPPPDLSQRLAVLREDGAAY